MKKEMEDPDKKINTKTIVVLMSKENYRKI